MRILNLIIPLADTIGSALIKKAIILKPVIFAVLIETIGLIILTMKQLMNGRKL